MELEEGQVRELIELQLNKRFDTYIFRYERGHEVEMINQLLMEAYRSIDFDFFDAAVMAYKVVRASSNSEFQNSSLCKDIAKATIDAMFCAVETEKYEYEKLQQQLFNNRIGRMGYFSIELERLRKRLDILVNNLIPSVKEYVNKVGSR